MITRRRFVQLVGGAAALASLPAGCGDNDTLVRGIYFDYHQWATIDLVSDYVLPGARVAMAVRYIDRLLAAFEQTPPVVFGGGPYSGRLPYPDTSGAPGSVFPPASFAKFLPLSRVQDLAWRMRVDSWRQMYADAIERLGQWRFLAPADQESMLYAVASEVPDWWQAMIEHTLEGTFAAPEYGGNDQLAGWKLASYDGDSQPLGHSYYDAALGDYVDRADQPTSQPSPGAQSEDFSPEVIDQLTVAALGTGGKRFF